MSLAGLIGKNNAVKIFFQRHKDGVAQINFKDPEEADACVQLFNNRWFNQRKITAETWDGKTKYRFVSSQLFLCRAGISILISNFLF